MTDVAVNGRFLTPRTTGLQRTARALVVGLRRAGVDLEVLAPPGTCDPLVDRHVHGPNRRVGGRLADQLWEQVALPFAARGRTVLSLANTAPLAAGRSIVTVHDLAPLVGPEWFVPSMRFYGALAVAAARRATLTVTVSEAVADDLRRRGVDRDRLLVLHPAVDDQFAPAPEEDVARVRRRWGLGDDPFLVFVGWADPRKDLATAVAAHRAARERRPHRLILVGAPHPVFRPVRSPADVVVVGHVTDGELVALLTGAEGLLYPSRYEGFGLPPLEAWACGTAALVSDLPVLRESTEGLGTYVPAGDVEAWTDAILRLLGGEVGVPGAPRRSWDDAAGELASAIWRLA